jgi:hypothetical protein
MSENNEKQEKPEIETRIQAINVRIQGQDFELTVEQAKTLQYELNNLFGFPQTFTTPYWPQVAPYVPNPGQPWYFSSGSSSTTEGGGVGEIK